MDPPAYAELDDCGQRPEYERARICCSPFRSHECVLEDVVIGQENHPDDGPAHPKSVSEMFFEAGSRLCISRGAVRSIWTDTHTRNVGMANTTATPKCTANTLNSLARISLLRSVTLRALTKPASNSGARSSNLRRMTRILILRGS